MMFPIATVEESARVLITGPVNFPTIVARSFTALTSIWRRSRRALVCRFPAQMLPIASADPSLVDPQCLHHTGPVIFPTMKVLRVILDACGTPSTSVLAATVAVTAQVG